VPYVHPFAPAGCMIESCVQPAGRAQRGAGGRLADEDDLGVARRRAGECGRRGRPAPVAWLLARRGSRCDPPERTSTCTSVARFVAALKVTVTVPLAVPCAHGPEAQRVVYAFGELDRQHRRTRPAADGRPATAGDRVARRRTVAGHQDEHGGVVGAVPFVPESVTDVLAVPARSHVAPASWPHTVPAAQPRESVMLLVGVRGPSYV